MRRVLLVVATLLVLGTAAIPLTLVRSADDRVAEADARNDAFVVADEPTRELPGRLITARRVPVALVVVAGRDRLAEVTAELATGLPEAGCLATSLDGVVIGGFAEAVPLAPASTLKLLTATAALEVMGVNGRLATEVRIDGAVDDGGVVAGDLWVVGGGDPLLATDDYAAAFARQPQTYLPLSELAGQIAAAGITRIDGRVLGDDGRYDRDRYVDSWPERYITQNNIGPLSALSVNDGFSSFDPTLVHSPDPAAWAAEALRDELAAIGIEVSGDVGSGSVPIEAAEVARLPSLAVSTLVAQLLTESDNNTAELLTREIGLRINGDGSTASGTLAVESVLARLGYDTTGVVVNDGSGLDRGNRATCSLLREILDRAGPTSPLADGLAVGGRSGTLTNRFTDPVTEGRIRAKTGFLNEINGLAGFVDGRDGHVITFALVTNGVPLESSLGFDLQDQVVGRLVGEPVLPPVDTLDLADS